MAHDQAGTTPRRTVGREPPGPAPVEVFSTRAACRSHRDAAATAAASRAPGSGTLPRMARCFEATVNQAGLFALGQVGHDAPISANISFVLDVGGDLDQACFAAALARLAQAHDALRTSFHLDGRRVMATVHDEAAFPCAVV